MENNTFYLYFAEDTFKEKDFLSANLKVVSEPKIIFQSIFHRVFYYITFCRFKNLASYKYKVEQIEL